MGYVIEPSAVLSSLNQEDASLKGLIQKVYSLQEKTNAFVTNDNLKGKAYDNFRQYYKTVHIPMLKGIILFAEEKISENEQYRSAINSSFGSVGRISEDELQQWLRQVVDLRDKARHDPKLTGQTLSLLKTYDMIEKNLQKIHDYIRVTNGIYSAGKSVQYLRQIERGNKCISGAKYDANTKSFQVIGLDTKWATAIQDMETQKFEEMAREKYGTYLLDHPEDKDKIVGILKYEVAHPEETKKVNDFLSIFDAKDTIGVKDIAYNSPADYRDLWIKYLDKYSIKTIDYNGNSCFNPNDNGIYLNLKKDRADERGIFAVIFHECGHAIDYNDRGERRRSGISGEYKDGNGKSLNDLIFADVKSELSHSIDDLYKDKEFSWWSAEDKKRAKSDILTNLTHGSEDKLLLSEKNVVGGLQGKYNYDLFKGCNAIEVSDIYGAVTNNQILGSYGHESKYWWSPDKKKMINYPNEECFAQYFSDNMMKNKKAIENSKKYLPNTYKGLDEIIKEMHK